MIELLVDAIFQARLAAIVFPIARHLARSLKEIVDVYARVDEGRGNIFQQVFRRDTYEVKVLRICHTGYQHVNLEAVSLEALQRCSGVWRGEQLQNCAK